MSSKDETSVFASAAPVSRADVEEKAETETPETTHETKTTPKAETKATEKTVTPGVPAWHLSLALGVVVALVGGVLLWLQSPVVAVFVVGGLVVLIGLALALRHFFRGAKQARAQAAQGGGAPASQRGPSSRRPWSRRDGTARDQSQKRETKPAQSRETRADRRSRSPRGETRKDQRETAGRKRGRDRETSSETRRDRKSQPPVSPRGHAPGGGPRGATPSGTTPRPTGRSTPTGRDVPPRGPRQPSGGGAPSGPRPMVTSGPVCGGRGTIPLPPKNTPDDKDDKGTKKIDPPSPPEISSATSKDVAPKEATEMAESIAWPNVDLDHYEPVQAHRLPRITVARKAVKLPPVYHRNGEPQWPVDDPDHTSPPIPPQRDRRSTVATPDMLTRAQRDQHYSDASTTALGLAEEKDLQAHELVRQAGELDGVEGMERVREDHLANAHRATHDGQVRRHLAAIYASWVQSN